MSDLFYIQDQSGPIMVNYLFEPCLCKKACKIYIILIVVLRKACSAASVLDLRERLEPTTWDLEYLRSS